MEATISNPGSYFPPIFNPGSYFPSSLQSRIILPSYLQSRIILSLLFNPGSYFPSYLQSRIILSLDPISNPGSYFPSLTLHFTRATGVQPVLNFSREVHNSCLIRAALPPALIFPDKYLMSAFPLLTLRV